MAACGSEAPSEPAGDSKPAPAPPAKPVTLDPKEGYVHPDSGVGFVYPDESYRYGKPRDEMSTLTTLTLYPPDDRSGNRLRVYVRWTAISDAPANADDGWLLSWLASAYSRANVTDQGTHEAGGITWRVMGVHTPKDGRIPEEWQRMYFHGIRRNGTLYSIELRIVTTDESRLQEVLPLLEHFRFSG